MKKLRWVLLACVALVAIPKLRTVAVAAIPWLASLWLRQGETQGGLAMSFRRWGRIPPYLAVLGGLPPLRVFLIPANFLK